MKILVIYVRQLESEPRRVTGSITTTEEKRAV